MTSHKKNLLGLDIDLLDNMSVETIDRMVKDFNTNICALEFYTIFPYFL